MSELICGLHPDEATIALVGHLIKQGQKWSIDVLDQKCFRWNEERGYETFGFAHLDRNLMALIEEAMTPEQRYEYAMEVMAIQQREGALPCEERWEREPGQYPEDPRKSVFTVLTTDARTRACAAIRALNLGAGEGSDG